MTTGRVIPIESMTPETKCGYCTNSKCCTYITQQIETPRSKRDFDFLLWQISHRDIRIYKDEGSWYMLVDNLCTHLQRDGRCGIYDDRPEICREYSNGSFRSDWEIVGKAEELVLVWLWLKNLLSYMAVP